MSVNALTSFSKKLIEAILSFSGLSS